MLISNGPDGTFTTGHLDVLLILHHVEAGTYHAAFFEEAPPPGPVQDVGDVAIVRLRSKLHHTTGASSVHARRRQGAPRRSGREDLRAPREPVA